MTENVMITPSDPTLNPASSLSPDEIVALYQEGCSVGDLCKRYGVKEKQTKRLLRERGVMRSRLDAVRAKCTKYSVNERFFESIETLEQCWMLGWLFSDGYNCISPADTRITLHSKDREVLVKMSALLENTRPLLEEPDYHRTSLIISRRRMAEDLHRLGCVQAKSLILQYPHEILNTKAKTCAFLRGLIEGDGCIHVRRTCPRTGPFVQLTIASGSPAFIRSIRQVFEQHWGMKGYLQRQAVRFQGKRRQMKAMLEDIYDLGALGLYLERKYQKHLEAMEVLNQAISTHYQQRNRLSKAPPAGVYEDTPSTPDPFDTPSTPHLNG